MKLTKINAKPPFDPHSIEGAGAYLVYTEGWVNPVLWIIDPKTTSCMFCGTLPACSEEDLDKMIGLIGPRGTVNGETPGITITTDKIKEE